MQHPEILIVPAIIGLNMYLSMYSARLHRGVYAEHVTYEDEALNARFKQQASVTSLVTWRRVLGLLAIVAVLYYTAEIEQNEHSLEGLFGLIFCMYAVQIGRNLFNIFLFRYLNSHPDALQGKVVYSTAATRFIGAIELIRLAPLILIVAYWCPWHFSYGLVGGYLLLWLMFLGGSRESK